MTGKYVFLICFLAVDVLVLVFYLAIYVQGRRDSKTLHPAIWASCPLLIAFLVLVPLVIVFENIMVTVILSSLIIAGYIFMLTNRSFRRYGYGRPPYRGWSRYSKKADSFFSQDEEDKLPF
jgi:predicted membrane metal-binding protein